VGKDIEGNVGGAAYIGDLPMGFLWTAEWATGHPGIDMQHRQLFRSINSLLGICRCDCECVGESMGVGSCDAFKETFEFLSRFVRKHFADEEALMRHYCYPGYEEHKKMHESIQRTVDDLDIQFLTDGPTSALASSLSTNVGHWLVTHIHHEDKKITAHIRATIEVEPCRFLVYDARSEEPLGVA
jgi:hemerythrin